MHYTAIECVPGRLCLPKSLISQYHPKQHKTKDNNTLSIFIILWPLTYLSFDALYFYRVCLWQAVFAKITYLPISP